MNSRNHQRKPLGSLSLCLEVVLCHGLGGSIHFNSPQELTFLTCHTYNHFSHYPRHRDEPLHSFFSRDICCDFNLYLMLPSLLPSLNASKTSEYSLTPSTLFLTDILHNKIPTNWNYTIGITSFTTVLATANNIY